MGRSVAHRHAIRGGGRVNGTDLVLLVVILVLVLVAGVLAVAETGVTRMTRSRAAAPAESDPKRGRRVQRIVDNPKGATSTPSTWPSTSSRRCRPPWSVCWPDGSSGRWASRSASC